MNGALLEPQKESKKSDLQKFQLRAGKTREWFEKLMREEPRFERKEAPKPEIKKIRMTSEQLKLCESLKARKIRKLLRNADLHPDHHSQLRKIAIQKENPKLIDSFRLVTFTADEITREASNGVSDTYNTYHATKAAKLIKYVPPEQQAKLYLKSIKSIFHPIEEAQDILDGDDGASFALSMFANIVGGVGGAVGTAVLTIEINVNMPSMIVMALMIPGYVAGVLLCIGIEGLAASLTKTVPNFARFLHTSLRYPKKTSGVDDNKEADAPRNEEITPYPRMNDLHVNRPEMPVKSPTPAIKSSEPPVKTPASYEEYVY